MNVNSVTIISRRFIQTVKPHRPLIKFRKGESPDPNTSHSADDINAYKQIHIRPVLEDFQLPIRYRRRPLDDAEIEAINSGGVH